MTQVVLAGNIETLLCFVLFVILALIIAHCLVGGKVHVDFRVSEKIVVFIVPSFSVRNTRALSLSRRCCRRRSHRRSRRRNFG